MSYGFQGVELNYQEIDKKAYGVYKFVKHLLTPRKSLHQHWGKPPGLDLSAAPFPFGVVAPTGDNGTSFPAIDEWDE